MGWDFRGFVGILFQVSYTRFRFPDYFYYVTCGNFPLCIIQVNNRKAGFLLW